MADTKVSALTAATPVGTDYVYLVDDPGGTPSSKRATVASLVALTSSAVNAVADHGADNTGSGDTTTEVAAAIAAAGPNGKVYFPAGTYLVQDVAIAADGAKLELFGDGRHLTTFKFNTSGAVDGDHIFDITSAADEIHFHDLGFDGSRHYAASSQNSAIDTDDGCDFVLVEDCFFKEFYSTEDNAAAVNLYRTRLAVVRNCDFLDNVHCINITEGEGATVTGNRIRNTANDSLPGPHGSGAGPRVGINVRSASAQVNSPTVVSHNIIESVYDANPNAALSVGDGDGHGVAILNSRHAVVANNSIRDCGRGVLIGDDSYGAMVIGNTIGECNESIRADLDIGGTDGRVLPNQPLGCVIANNTIYRSVHTGRYAGDISHGITTSYSAGAHIIGNYIYDSDNYPIHSDSDSVLIKDNYIQNGWLVKSEAAGSVQFDAATDTWSPLTGTAVLGEDQRVYFTAAGDGPTGEFSVGSLPDGDDGGSNYYRVINRDEGNNRFQLYAHGDVTQTPITSSSSSTSAWTLRKAIVPDVTHYGGISVVNRTHTRIIDNTIIDNQTTSQGNITGWDAGTDTWTLTGHTLANGDRIRFRITTEGSEVPTEFDQDTDYYVINVSGDNFQLALTPGGAAIAGSGTLSQTWEVLQYVPTLDYGIAMHGQVTDGRVEGNRIIGMKYADMDDEAWLQVANNNQVVSWVAATSTLDVDSGPLVMVDTSGGAVTLYLPSNVQAQHRLYKIVRTGGSAVTIDNYPGTSETIETASTYTLSTDGAWVELLSVGDGDWKVVTSG